MNFDEFVNEVKDRVKDFLPADYADASVEVMKSRKLNHTSPALVVKKEGQEFAPSIDLDQFFQELEYSSMEEVLERVAELAQRKPDGIEYFELTVGIDIASARSGRLGNRHVEGGFTAVCPDINRIAACP